MSLKQRLTVKNLSKTFHHASLQVLKNVSLQVGENELVSIVGSSGCGKSTLLDLITGLTKPDSGEILLKEKPVYMMQDDNLFPWRNVLDNAILPLEIAGVKKDLARDEASKLLFEFGLGKFAKFYPFMLSGGMRQRVALLRTYLGKKDLMLLDEPFSKLDALTRRQMQEWFLSIWQTHKKSVLFVTHDVDEAIFLSDRIYVMSNRPGEVVGRVTVDFPRPRKANVYNDRKFIVLRQDLLRLLLND